MAFLISHISGHRKTWSLALDSLTSESILHVLTEKEGSVSDVLLWNEGRRVYDDFTLSPGGSVVATLRLHGGKGGFGSMLRAIGAQIEKTTNREACRDLSGRRLRDINEEKRLKEFISKKAERERDAMERKQKKFDKLRETPKHTFTDPTYYEQREIREKNLHDSLDKAFASGSADKPSCKRKCTNTSNKQKKGRFMDDLNDSSEDSSDSDCEKDSKSTRRSPTTTPNNETDNTNNGSTNIASSNDSDNSDSNNAPNNSGLNATPKNQTINNCNNNTNTSITKNETVNDGSNTSAKNNTSITSKNETDNDNNNISAKNNTSITSKNETDNNISAKNNTSITSKNETGNCSNNTSTNNNTNDDLNTSTAKIVIDNSNDTTIATKDQIS